MTNCCSNLNMEAMACREQWEGMDLARKVLLADTVETADMDTVGMVADSVSDVLDLPASQVLPPPDFGPRRHSDCVEGLVDVDGGLVLILDLHRMLVADGIVEIHEGALAGQEAA